MIFTDGVHLATNGDPQDLHKFAESIGLKRHYYHGVRKGHPHYDILNRAYFEWAIAKGAIYVRPRELIIKCFPG